eukprot:770837_1
MSAKQKWSKLKVTMPQPSTANFGVTPVLNDQYVLLFGGYTGSGTFSKVIWIFHVSTQTFRKSKISCPTYISKACTITDYKRDELLVFGFIRDITKDQFPPIYLTKLVQSWYCRGMTHLINISSGYHWKINTITCVAKVLVLYIMIFMFNPLEIVMCCMVYV